MKRSKTKTFVHELPLVVTIRDERILLNRFEAGRRIYNAVLSEALRRQDAMRQSKQWQTARMLENKWQRSTVFPATAVAYRFTSAALSAFGTQCKNDGGFKNRLGAHETQRISERAFNADQEFVFGKRGRPRFKGSRQPLKSLEGKSNVTGIQWNSNLGCVEWNKLTLTTKFPPNDEWTEQAVHRRVKYCRVVWRIENGRRRWFVQLMREGIPPIKKNQVIGYGQEVGLDLGPSIVAIDAEGAPSLVKFAATVDQPWKEIKRTQRAMDRSRRTTNPECYNDDGTWRKGAKVSVRSTGYIKLQTELAEAERKLASERKRSHGELSNCVIEAGSVVKTETISYKAWQKMFGRSVKVRAPSMFINAVKRKAESAGGELRELPTRKLKMSQYDHTTNEYTKKPLSQRWTVLGDGSAIVQRDAYSAFLARCVDNNKHNPSRIKSMWAAQEPALRAAGLCFDQFASGKAQAFPTVKPSERIAAYRRFVIGHGADGVSLRAREPQNPDEICLRNPTDFSRG